MRLFATSSLILLCSLFLLPLIALASKGIGAIEFSDLKNLWNIFFQGNLALNTLIVSLGTLFFSTLWGSAAAFSLWALPRQFKSLGRFCYVLPLVIPSYFTTLNWMHWLGKKGTLPTFLAIDTSDFIYSPLGCAWALSFQLFPLIAFPLESYLKKYDFHSWQVSRFQLSTFNRLKFLILKPFMGTLSGSWILIGALAAVDFNVPSLLRVNVYPIEIFSQFSAFYNEKVALLYSLPLMGGVLVFAGFLLIQFKKRSFHLIPQEHFKPSQKNKLFAIFIFIVLISLTTLIPIGTFISKIETVSNFLTTLHSAAGEALTSLKIAFFSASALLLIALLMLFLINRASPSFQLGILGALLLILGAPGTLWGIGSAYLFNRQNFLGDIYRSLVIVGFVQGIQILPFVILWMRQQTLKWSKNIWWVAKIQKVSPKNQFTHLTIPLWGNLLSQSWVLASLFCLTELAGSLLVIPPGGTTLPVRFFTLVHYGQEFMSASISLLFVLLTISLASIPALIFKGNLKHP